jgi:hypothetical protein
LSTSATIDPDTLQDEGGKEEEEIYEEEEEEENVEEVMTNSLIKFLVSHTRTYEKLKSDES